METDGDGDRLIWQLRRAFHTVEAEKERRLRDTGVTGPHYAILMHVGLAEGLTSAELARRLQLSPQNIAGLVAKLESTGWLERRVHPLHGHVRELHLTASGDEARRRADTVVAAVEVEIAAMVQAYQPGLGSALLRLAGSFPPAY